MARSLGVREGETKGQLAGEQVRGERGPSTPASRIAASVGARSRLASRRPSSCSDQRMVEIGRLGQAEQRLEQPLDRGRGPQVRAADDQGHAARGIVDDAGEMIGGRRILAGEDGVADVALRCAVNALPSCLGPASAGRRAPAPWR